MRRAGDASRSAVFFPLGVVLGALGIGHWLAYAAGASSGYSCLAHGPAQFRRIPPAFALGFLLAAGPRRTQSAPPSGWLLVGAATGTGDRDPRRPGREHEALGQAALIAVVLAWLGFAVRRASTRAAGRRPPAQFVVHPHRARAGARGCDDAPDGIARLRTRVGAWSRAPAGDAGGSSPASLSALARSWCR